MRVRRPRRRDLARLLSHGIGVLPPAIAATGTVVAPVVLGPDRVVEVRVSATSGPRGVVTSVSMLSPYFTTSGTVPMSVPLVDGDESLLAVPLGNPVCPPAEGVTVAAVEARAEAGTALTTTHVTLDDEALAAINAEECRQKVTTNAPR